MGARNAHSVTIRPSTVTDSLDGTNAIEGSMTALQNLILAYHTDGVFAPRPAAVKVADLSPINYAGIVSALFVLGTRAYGFITSSTYSGKDEPFCFDFNTLAFVPLAGVTSALLPNAATSSGDWVPPQIVAATNSIIIFCHPGFIGGTSPFFGWLDTSGYTSTVMRGNTASGSNVISSVYTLQGNSAPILQGVTPGQAISGAGIPLGAYVVSAVNGTFSLNTTGNTHSNTTLDSLGSTTGVAPGMTVTGPGILVGTTVQTVNSSTSVTLSQAVTATGTGVAINFSGGGSITISANATATANNVALTVAGGTLAAPRWSAGNTNTNPLAQVPTCAAGFNGRGYFGFGPYLVYSDPLNPLQVSLATQALVIGDSTPITALTGVPLTSQLTGGVQQSLTVFKGSGSLYQITGDPLTGNLAQNAVTGSVGTLAPNSLASTPVGTAFMAIDGLRILGLSGTVSEPIGAGGTGVNVPFLNAVYPSRMCADYAENIYRITVQNGAKAGNPFEEYWFDLNRKVWTGPHSFPARLICSNTQSHSSIMAPLNVAASLWQSDSIPTFNSTYTENGQRLQCLYQTTLLSDNNNTSFNRVGQASLTIALASADVATVTVVDDGSNTLGSYTFSGASAPTSLWGSFIWGSGSWGTGVSGLREYALRFAQPLIFRQARVKVAFAATQGQSVGNIYIKLQSMGINAPPTF